MTLEDQVLALLAGQTETNTKLDTIIAAQNAAAATVDLSGVLSAIAGVKIDTAALLAQDEPTPAPAPTEPPAPSPDSAPAA